MNSQKSKRAGRARSLSIGWLALVAAPGFAVELAAVPGQWTPPGGGTPVPMWGYVEVSDAATYPCPAVPVSWTRGPTVRTTVAAGLTVNLKNCLAEPVSFFAPGLRATSAIGGSGRFTAEAAAGGGMATYTLALRPGSFLYHSATDRIRTHVPMGLYGALVVDSAAGTAYPDVTYDQDEVLVFSEIDPALNADPGGRDGAKVVNWDPKYFLVNGEAYSAAASPVAFAAGDRVLLRLVNAGLETVVPTLEGGLYADLVAEDGNRYPQPLTQYGVELPAAKTVDALIQVANAGTYALYDRALHLTNGAATGGGMLTYLAVGAGSGFLEFSAPSYNVAENVAGGLLSVTVNRVGNSSAPADVHYATGTGTATPGVDYTAVSGTLSFAAGETSRSFTVAIADDAANEGDETFPLVLSSPIGASLGTPSSATVTIADDDLPGSLQLSAVAYNVSEGGGSVTVTVNRSGGSAGAVSVNYATANGSATAGADFAAASGTLSFAAGVVSQSFPVAITDDTTYEGDETFLVSLSAPTGGATLGAPSNATVTIAENDAAPNAAPIANDDSATARRNSTGIIINLTANDTDADGSVNASGVEITTGSATQFGGAVSKNPDGTVTYVPKKNFRGTDTFQYRVPDNLGAWSNVATVRVNVVQ